MGSSPTGHPTKNPLLLCNSGFFLWWGTQWDENRAAVRSTVSNQPSGLLLSPRVPTIRNVYRGPTLQLFLTADFFVWVPSGTRKARHCRRQGNKQPSGLFVSARVPTIRNVYRGPTLQLFLTADFFCVGTQLARTQNHRYSSGGVHQMMDASAFSLTGSSAAGSLRSRWWCSPLSAGHWQWTCHSCHGCAAVPP